MAKYNLSHPTCAEDLTCLFVEGMTQKEKYQAIMRAYAKCNSVATAKRWMKKFDLLKKSTMAIHLEKTQNAIDNDIKKPKEEEITISKVYFEISQKTVDELFTALIINIKDLRIKIGEQEKLIKDLQHQLNKKANFQPTQPIQPINPAQFGTTEVQISGPDLFNM